jgi:hypothetical protein
MMPRRNIVEKLVYKDVSATVSESHHTTPGNGNFDESDEKEIMLVVITEWNSEILPLRSVEL